MKQSLKKGFLWLKKAYSTLVRHKYTTIAGALVFFVAMSFVPFFFWLSLLFGKTGMNFNQIFELEIFDWAKELLAFFRANAEGATAGVTLLFLATTLWSSTSFFYHLRKSGEIIYSYKRKKHGWKVRVSAVIFTFLLFLFFALAGAVLVGVNLLAKSLPKLLFYLTVYSIVLAFGFFAAWLLNLYICPYRPKPSELVTGSLFTAIAWLVASVAFSVYIKFATPERLYGALSLVIVFLLWLYWMMICFTSGVIYNCRSMQLHRLEPKTL